MESKNGKEIKGYDKLSSVAKRVFLSVYRRHHNAAENFDPWMATEVKEHKDHIEVHFKNGEWLHYMPDGTWY